MSPLRVRAPATTSNLGPGFDCAGVALDLWNELEVESGEGVEVEGEGADEAPASVEHLGLRAFSLLAPVEGRRFRFVNRIPFERGLGSSAATIALGLVAGALAAGRKPDAEELLALGFPLEGHGDNLAAALAGGVTLTWERRIARVADGLPLTPIAVIPSERVSTRAARNALPAQVTHADAAFTAGRATLLGAALAAGDADLLAESFHDRLHEPYRGVNAPLLDAIRSEPPADAAGVTLSGSGPTVIVWARPAGAAACAQELERRYPAARTLSLSVVSRGAA
jgi:homoserine kinase